MTQIVHYAERQPSTLRLVLEGSFAIFMVVLGGALALAPFAV